MANVSSSNSQKALVPKLRFPGFEGEWENRRMDELFTEIIEKNHTDYPVLSILQGSGTVLRDNSDRRISYDKNNLNNYKLLERGDFIIHLRSFEGGLECSNHVGIVSPAYKILRTKSILPEAYKDYFRSYRFVQGKLSIAVTGIRDGKNIDMPSFWEISIAIPKLAEQKKIAAFMNLLERRIDAQRCLVEALKSYKRGVIERIFSDDNCRTWKRIKLSEILSERKEYCEKDGTFVHATLSKDGVSEKTDRYDRDFLVTTEEKKYKVTHKNDLCYNPANLKFGVICVNDFGDAIFSPIYITFEICPSVEPHFLGMQVMRWNFINRALKFQQGTVYERTAVSPEDLLSMSIVLPPIEIQRKVSNAVQVLSTKISIAECIGERMSKLKSALLSQLFI